MKVFQFLLSLVLCLVITLYIIPTYSYSQVSTNLSHFIYPTPTPLPPPAVTTLASQANMTAAAKSLFFAAHPQIDSDRRTFDRHCQAPVSANSIELGCFTTQNQIYLWNISDPLLRSEMVATAAHEMLHAAYAQLSTTDRQTLDKQLEANLPSLQNKDLARQLLGYNQTEPGQRDNELHSIIGTEYAILSPQLEQYYKKYFTNRQTVVADAEAFDQVFDSLEQQIADLGHQLSVAKKQMHLNQSAGNILAYNAEVPRYNQLAIQYNQLANRYNLLSRNLTNNKNLATTQ